MKKVESMRKGCMTHWLFGLTLLCAGPPSAGSKELSLAGQANVMVEISFQAERAYVDPFFVFFDVVIFFDSCGVDWWVPAVWDGGFVWIACYVSPLVGRHPFRG